MSSSGFRFYILFLFYLFIIYLFIFFFAFHFFGKNPPPHLSSPSYAIVILEHNSSQKPDKYM